jgi:hypothetical protein
MNVFAASDDLKALVCSIEGEVLTLHPSVEKESEGTILFEGKKFKSTKTKIGQHIDAKDVIMTASNGKAKVIYKTGDVIIVGPSSFFTLPHGLKVGSNGKQAELVYGKIRAVINPSGPLSGVKIVTPSAVAGVRGTDFYISFNPASQVTKVDTIRGVIQAEGSSTQKSVAVKAGETLETSKKDPAPAQAKKADQEELGKVQVDSSFVAEKQPAEDVSPQAQAEVQKANVQAQENILADIRHYDPKAAERLASNKQSTTDDLNTASLYTVYSKAAPVQNKAPGKEDLLYEKYFKSLGY